MQCMCVLIDAGLKLGLTFWSGALLVGSGAGVGAPFCHPWPGSPVQSVNEVRGPGGMAGIV